MGLLVFILEQYKSPGQLFLEYQTQPHFNLLESGYQKEV